MSTVEEFTEAFQLVDRYEEYRLIRIWGMIVITIGIARFFMAWIISNTFLILLKYLDFDLTMIAIINSLFKNTVSFLLIIALAILIFYAYFSLKKTGIRNSEIISEKVLYFGLALVVVYFLTFIVAIPGSVYFEEVAGVFIAYFLLRKCTKYSDFKEMLYLCISLFCISIVEFAWRIIWVIIFYNVDMDSPPDPIDQMSVPIFIISYLVIGFAFMIPYIISGLYSIKKASKILEES